MNDKELLKLAAKAAGIDGVWTVGADFAFDPPRPTEEFWLSDEYGNWSIEWNPLTDDGDALRLAVKCGISVGPESADVIGKSLCRASWLNKTHSLGEYGDGDPYAATRRAIVRAAAEIGRTM